MKRIIFYLLFIPLFFIPSVTAHAAPTTPTITGTQDVVSQIDALNKRIDSLRDEDYQKMVTDEQKLIDKTSYYVNNFNFLATVFGIFFSVSGVLITAFAVVFAYGIFSVRKDLQDEMKNLQTYVDFTRNKADEVKKLSSEAKKLTSDVIPKIIKDIQSNQVQINKFFESAKQEKKQLSEEFNKEFTKLQNRQLSLNQELLGRVSEVNTLNSQATIASGISLYPVYAQPVKPYTGGAVSLNETNINPISNIFQEKTCVQCGNRFNEGLSLSLNNDTPTLEVADLHLCQNCITKKQNQKLKI